MGAFKGATVSDREYQTRYVAVCDRARALGVDVTATDDSTMEELADRIDALVQPAETQDRREALQRLADDVWDLVPGFDDEESDADYGAVVIGGTVVALTTRRELS